MNECGSSSQCENGLSQGPAYVLPQVPPERRKHESAEAPLYTTGDKPGN